MWNFFEWAWQDRLRRERWQILAFAVVRTATEVEEKEGRMEGVKEGGVVKRSGGGNLMCQIMMIATTISHVSYILIFP
jgi:hypothetical protein